MIRSAVSVEDGNLTRVAGFVALNQRKQSCDHMTLNISSSPGNAVSHRNAPFAPKSKLGCRD